MSNLAHAERLPCAPVAHLANGELLDGKYRIEGTLAQGGCGVVVLATQVQLERPVAIKYLRPEMLSHRHVVALFEREARLAAKLRSEHVVGIHDVGVSPEIGPYLVMEYLEGKDLQTLLDEAAFGVVEAVDYILQACEALAEAHDLDIVHRDLKPANLFLAAGTGGSHVLKVIDFGIAKSVAKHAAGSEDRSSPGTPGYMSPEQIDGERIDGRSDIWALGVVLYELLSVRMPWPDGSPTEQLEVIRAQPPAPLRAFRPDVPPALEAVVMRCLREKAAERFQSVRDLAAALRAIDLSGVNETGRRVAFVPQTAAIQTIAAPTSTPTSIGRRKGARAAVLAAVSFVAAATALTVQARSDERGHDDALADLATASDLREPVVVTTRLALQEGEDDKPVSRAAPATPIVVPVRTTTAPSPAPADARPTKVDRRALFGEGRL